MSYFPRDPISRSQLYLDLMSNRQEALSSNLANMDTPNDFNICLENFLQKCHCEEL